MAKKTKNDLISIIIPVYNIENYVSPCIKSVINQSYKNIEIIIVNDGSTDQSPYICEAYKNIDPRIKILHQKNQGLSEARNNGVKISKGKYITFIDGDDIVVKDYVKKMYDTLIKTHSDIVLAGFNRNEEIDKNILDTHKTAKVEQILSTLYENELNLVPKIHACVKLIKANIVKQHPFPKGKFAEDLFTTYKWYLSAKKITYLFSPLYYYIKRDDSLMGQKYNLRHLQPIEALENIMVETNHLKYNKLHLIKMYITILKFNHTNIIKNKINYDLNILDYKYQKIKNILIEQGIVKP